MRIMTTIAALLLAAACGNKGGANEMDTVLDGLEHHRQQVCGCAAGDAPCREKTRQAYQEYVEIWRGAELSPSAAQERRWDEITAKIAECHGRPID